MQQHTFLTSPISDAGCCQTWNKLETLHQREKNYHLVLQHILLLAKSEWRTPTFAAELNNLSLSDDIVIILPHVWVKNQGAAAAEGQQRKGQCFWPRWDLCGSARPLCRLHIAYNVCLVWMWDIDLLFTHINALQQNHRDWISFSHCYYSLITIKDLKPFISGSLERTQQGLCQLFSYPALIIIIITWLLPVFSKVEKSWTQEPKQTNYISAPPLWCIISCKHCYTSSM